MLKERKEYLDSLWMDTDVGKWVLALSKGQKEEADKIREELFDQGILDPIGYIMGEENALCDKVRAALQDPEEVNEFLDELEKCNYGLIDVMVAYEFSMLDLYTSISPETNQGK